MSDKLISIFVNLYSYTHVLMVCLDNFSEIRSHYVPQTDIELTVAQIVLKPITPSHLGPLSAVLILPALPYLPYGKPHLRH